MASEHSDQHDAVDPNFARPRAAGPIDGWSAHNDLLLYPPFANRLLTAGMESLDGIFALENDLSLAKPGLETWRERLCVELPGKERVFIKRFKQPPSSAQRLVRRARCGARSLAGVEWRRLCEFAELGIPAAMPLAFGEELRRGREIRSAVVVQAVEGESLERKCNDSNWPDGPMLRRLLPQLAALVARMHAAGLVHRDLYLGHIFLNAATFELRLIDLQRVLRPEFFQSRWFVKDLAQLNYSVPSRISRTERLRFLRLYMGENAPTIAPRNAVNGFDAGSRRLLRQIFYRIIGKTAQIAAHDRSRRSRIAAQCEP